MCTEVRSDFKKLFSSGMILRNNKNFGYENYSTCSRKLSTNFSLIHDLSCYLVSFAASLVAVT